jgi:hypothetical protein
MHLRAQKVPEAVVEVTGVILSRLSPPPDPAYVLDQFAGPSARHVREAYKAGERDRGRLAYLVARHVLHMPAAAAWGAVPLAAAAFPGRVQPSFLAEAEGHIRQSFGAMQTPDAEGEERWVPWILGAVALAALCTLPTVFADSTKPKVKVSHA